MSDKRDDALGTEFLTPMREGFAAQHEMFLEMMASGYTEKQALYFLAALVSIVMSDTKDET